MQAFCACAFERGYRVFRLHIHIRTGVRVQGSMGVAAGAGPRAVDGLRACRGACARLCRFFGRAHAHCPIRACAFALFVTEWVSADSQPRIGQRASVIQARAAMQERWGGGREGKGGRDWGRKRERGEGGMEGEGGREREGEGGRDVGRERARDGQTDGGRGRGREGGRKRGRERDK